ncbi:MAG: sialate O-acetylesterase [Candidatus Brocadiia bacterium]
MQTLHIILSTVILLLTIPIGTLRANVKLPAVFSEGMVLQRDRKIPVWGWADDGEKVKISIYNRGTKPLIQAQTVARNGRFRLTLDPLPVGGPYTMLMEAKNRFIFTDILVGEVWITCGQSNAIWPVSETASIEEARANRDKYPGIRHIQLGHRKYRQADKPYEKLGAFWGRPKWEDSRYSLMRSNKDIPGCQNAIGYYFAREVYKHFDGKVPVGTIDIGAIIRVESWVADRFVAKDPVLEKIRGKRYPHETSRAYNANIAPLSPYPVRGAIYYQGEMNAGNAKVYRHGLEMLIKSWRAAWDDPDMPFLIVQLPGFIKHKGPKHKYDMDAKSLASFKGNDASHGFVGIRQAQLQVWQNTPHTGMAVTIDLGEPFNIHPPRKREVAERLFLQARKVAYGDEEVLASGPVPAKFQKINNGFAIEFKNIGRGLSVKGKNLTGFELAGENGNFTVADARIEGDRVIVTSGEIQHPSAVRYAWKGYPQVSLYNKKGLPATPFRHLPKDQNK